MSGQEVRCKMEIYFSDVEGLNEFIYKRTSIISTLYVDIYTPVRSEKVRYGFSLTIWRLIMYSEIEGLVIFYQVEVH